MMQADDPPFLTVGTEVSAKYKGAFCEAKVNKVVKVVKVKVTFKYGIGSAVVTDDGIKGVLKIGAQVKALHPDKNQHLEAIVNKIQDCSQYTVVFDDGDITTLRRTSLCLKSGRHFAESETLDQLPLTHPEHFGTPVVGGRRGRRSRHHPDSDEGSSEEDDNVQKRHRSRRQEWEPDIGKVVCVEIGDKKKQNNNWFPGLVVAPTAQDSVKIETKKDYLVRSFQDGRYYTVPKKEATSFNREIGSRVTHSSLRTAVEKALLYIDRDDLPPHWDRDLLFGVDMSDYDLDKDSDSDSSDDEPREEKDHFVAQLYKYMEECGTPINKGPTIGTKDLDLYKLFKVVQKLGGFNRVMNQNQWKIVSTKMCLNTLGFQGSGLVKAAYKKYLQSFEDFYRKLGCTMVSSPRGSRTRHRSGRSIIRDCDKRPASKLKGHVGGPDTDTTEDDEKKGGEEDEAGDEEVKKEEVIRWDATPAKKSDISLRRSTTPAPPPRTMSPTTRERTKELQSKALRGGKTSLLKEESPRPCGRSRKDDSSPSPSGRRGRKEEEEPRTRSSLLKESESEDDVEKAQTRSLRPKADTDTSQPVKMKLRQEHHQRSASSNSTSSGTSSTSTSTATSCGTSSSTGGGTSGGPNVSGKGKSGATKEQKEQLLGEDRKKGRKKRTETSDGEAAAGKSLLPAQVPICVGDRLRVLYGPNNKESKVTYEAKVLEVEEGPSHRLYYVHYLGWNTRYDEWVGRQRVAQNLTWCQARSKKMRGASKEVDRVEKKEEDKEVKREKEVTNSPASRQTPPNKRGRPFQTSRREGDKNEALLGTSATRAVTRGIERSGHGQGSTPGLTSSPGTDRGERRRSRRNVSSSVRDTEDSESDDSECWPDLGSERTGTSTPQIRKLKDPQNRSPVSSSSGRNPTPDRTPSPYLLVVKKEELVKVTGTDAPTLGLLAPVGGSCGKDIDLKAIESEMKGLDKPIKKEDIASTIREIPGTGLLANTGAGRILTTVIPGSLTITEKKRHDPKKPFDSPVKRVEIPVRLVPAQEIMGQIKPVPITGMKKEPLLEDDIYEFKEPEPFEFSDIRSRKEGSKAGRGSGGLSEDADTPPELKIKRKGRPRKDGEDRGESESDGGFTPQKRGRDTPPQRGDNRDSTPVRRELKDYSRKPDLLKNSPEALQARASTALGTSLGLNFPMETGEKTPVLIDIFGRDKRSPLDIKDLKFDLNDPKSHFIGSSVVITPKKLPVKKEPPDPAPGASPIKTEFPIQENLPVPGALKMELKDDQGNMGKESPNVCVTPGPGVSTPGKVKPIAVMIDRGPANPVLSRISGTGHVLAQVVMPPVDSRVISKPIPKPLTDPEKGFGVSPQTISGTQKEEKMMPFSQRQQHIFPHLLSRPEPPAETLTHEVQRPPPAPRPLTPVTLSATSQASASSCTANSSLAVQGPSTSSKVPSVGPAPAVAPAGSHGGDQTAPPERVRTESNTVEESIEAVVLRVRQEQMAEEEPREPAKVPPVEPLKDTPKSGEKRRRNPGRNKKVSREIIPDTSEESDSDTKGESRPKRLKSLDGVGKSPNKRGSRNSTGEDKKALRRCEDEDKGNDADEEDNEGSSLIPRGFKDGVRRRKESEDGETGDASFKRHRSLSHSGKRTEEDEANLGDLLCEETIPPGSPMPHDALGTDPDAPVLTPTPKQEMPFASVPTGSSFGKRGSQPEPPAPVGIQSNLQMSLQQLHPSVCVQSVTKGVTSSSNSQAPGTGHPTVPPTIQPNVTITSLNPNILPPSLPTSKVPPLEFRSAGPSAGLIHLSHVSAAVRAALPPPRPNVEAPAKSPGVGPLFIHEGPAKSPVPNSPSATSNIAEKELAENHKLSNAKVDDHIEAVRPVDPVPGRAGHGPIHSIDNTPPTTPESMVSNLSDSPQRDNESLKLDESSKNGGQYSSEIDIDNKMDNYSEDSNTMDSATSHKSHRPKNPLVVPRMAGQCLNQSHSEGWDTEDGLVCQPYARRRKNRGNKSKGEEDPTKGGSTPSTAKRRRRHSSTKGDEEHDIHHGLNTLSLAACHSARGKSRYNFCQELDPDLDAGKRIAVLQSRMQDLKRTYMQVKAELASVERRRKKLRKKEREKAQVDET